jgi:4-diphosphocytidyl-2-C-methyl-D-erythritol kinase
MTPTSLLARCPAKVNLSLRILGRRPDGYHELETVYQAIDLWDTLEIGPGEGLSMTSDQPELPTDETNLVLRAAREFRQAHGCRGRGAVFRLRKRIPVGAGLGGGSSDAAGALRLLTRFWDRPVSEEDLRETAARVGADVAYFLVGGTALGLGKGERVRPLPFVGELPILLGLPPFGLSTGEVYRLWSEREAARGKAGTGFAKGSGEGPDRLTLPENDVSVSRLLAHKLPGGNNFGVAANDLERVVFERWPELALFRDALLDAGAFRALLSGSGSTVFGIFEAKDRLTDAAETLRRAFGQWTLRASSAIPGASQIVAR